ncbi:hypothetical protein EC973_008346 [Apophysomyces ossiformis]|uniref:Major facilitator superfamily (MFS) profile domain-containing protein n=1 Tax=Apophysomyces ossiformis TaxID=679940 RepID=A0A8H7EVD1_9FUNG|nr:hypothetical protein EC973_008346 [Apophysomyces ossiformis]
MDSVELKTPGYMLYCVLIACLGSFSNGWVIGSPNVPGEITHNCPTGNAHLANPKFPDCLPMDNALWGFAVASFCVGGLVGGLVGGPIQTKVGRKRAIILNTSGWIVGGILGGLAVNTAMFVVGRIFCGLACGLGSLAIPTYIGEISTIRSRGAMGTCHQFFIVIGILLSSVVGLPTANVPLWRVTYAIVGIPAVVQALMMTTCSESPRWLVSVNRIQEAKQALGKLRGHAKIENEFYEIVEGQVGTAAATSILRYPEEVHSDLKEKQKKEEESEKDMYPEEEDSALADVPSGRGGAAVAPTTAERGAHEAMSMLQVFRDPVTCRIALTVLILHAIQQLIGMNAVMYFSTMIFSAVLSQDMSKYMTIVSTFVNFAVTLIAVALIDRMGRRPLLLLAEAGATVFSVTLVIGYAFNIGPLLVVSVFCYVASFAIGIGPIPWLITSEMSPTYAASSVGAAATAVNWAMNFFIGQIFPVWFAAIGGYAFAIFAGIGVLSFLFTFLAVPETKNRSIESIVRGYEKYRR